MNELLQNRKAGAGSKSRNLSKIPVSQEAQSQLAKIVYEICQCLPDKMAAPPVILVHLCTDRGKQRVAGVQLRAANANASHRPVKCSFGKPSERIA